MAIPVAQYIRMSTDQQDLSLELQTESIARYAEAHDLEVVRTYADAGKSGLSLSGRDAMRQLLRDVLDRNCPFESILVLDVSRWGRYQDVDEAAYYEYHCRSNGINVVYVAEPFKSGATPFDSILKQLKRAMAAEYSRELAVKCRAGQVKTVTLGFACGVPPCIGYVRESVSADGSRRTTLARGQRKPSATDRVRWVLASDYETALIRRIFTEYVSGKHTTEIVADLNREGELTQRGTKFSVPAVNALLRSDVVAGVFRWGKRARRDSARSVIGPLSVPASNDFMVPAIIDEDTYQRAQERRRRAVAMRGEGFSRDEMLEKLRGALQANPQLRADQFRGAGVPSPTAYRSHFGSLLKAYAEAGRETAWDEAWAISNAAGRKVGKQFFRDVRDLVRAAGVDVVADTRRHLLNANGIEVKVRTARHLNTLDGERWLTPHAHKDRAPNRWLLVMRMNKDRASGLDFFLLPPRVHDTFSGKLGPSNLASLKGWHLLDHHKLRDSIQLVFSAYDSCVSC